jgi:hypothetical protein
VFSFRAFSGEKRQHWRCRRINIPLLCLRIGYLHLNLPASSLSKPQIKDVLTPMMNRRVVELLINAIKTDLWVSSNNDFNCASDSVRVGSIKDF